MVTKYDRIHQSRLDWKDDTPTLHDRDDDLFSIDHFRTGYDEDNAFAVRMSRVVVDASKIKDVYVAIEPFEPQVIAAHGMLVFTMHGEQGVMEAAVREQGASKPRGHRAKTRRASELFKDGGFALSVESRRSETDHFTIVNGFERNYGVAYRLGGIADQIQRVTRLEGHELWMHRLDLTKDQKVNLVRDVMTESTRDHDGRWYHSLTDSCFTACVDLLNDVLEPGQKMARWTRFFKFARILTSLPSMGSIELRGKGLICDESIKVITAATAGARKFTPLNRFLRDVAKSWYAKLACTVVVCMAGFIRISATAIDGLPYAMVCLAYVSGCIAAVNKAFDAMWVKNNFRTFTGPEWYTQEFGCDERDAEAMVSGMTRNVA